MSKQKTTDLVTTVRAERGYSATNYDASAVKLQKTLRRQFGQKYDEKKVRNNNTPSAKAHVVGLNETTESKPMTGRFRQRRFPGRVFKF